MDRGSGHIGQVVQRLGQGQGNGDLADVEDQAQEGGQVDHGKQHTPPGQLGFRPVGYPIHGSQLRADGVDQNIEEKKKKGGQSQALVSEQGQGDGEAHKAVIAEGGGQYPAAPPVVSHLAQEAEAPVQDAVGEKEEKAQPYDNQPLLDKSGIVRAHQGNKDGGGHGDVHQQAGKGFGRGQGNHTGFGAQVPYPDEEEQPQQGREHFADIQQRYHPFTGKFKSGERGSDRANAPSDPLCARIEMGFVKTVVRGGPPAAGAAAPRSVWRPGPETGTSPSAVPEPGDSGP